MGATGVFGYIAADGAGLLAARVGCVEEAVGGCCFRKLDVVLVQRRAQRTVQRGAGLRERGEVRLVRLEGVPQGADARVVGGRVQEDAQRLCKLSAFVRFYIHGRPSRESTILHWDNRITQLFINQAP